jgi:hypothetical protein
VTVQAGAGVMPCPDGKSRVAVQFTVDNSQYTLVVDAEATAADVFADQLAASIKQAAAKARRANSGSPATHERPPWVAPGVPHRPAPLPSSPRGGPRQVRPVLVVRPRRRPNHGPHHHLGVRWP